MVANNILLLNRLTFCSTLYIFIERQKERKNERIKQKLDFSVTITNICPYL